MRNHFGKGHLAASPFVTAIGDIAFFEVAVALTLWLTGATASDANSVVFFAGTAVILVLSLLAFDLYRPRRVTTRAAARFLARPLALTALIWFSVAYALGLSGGDRFELIVAFVVGLIFVVGWRAMQTHLQNRARGRERVALVLDRSDSGDDQRRFLSSIAAASTRHLEVVEVLDEREALRWLAGEEGHDIDVVIVSPSVSATVRSSITMSSLVARRSVVLVPAPFEVALSASVHGVFHGVESILLSSTASSIGTRAVKRLLDVVVALVALSVLVPVAIVVGIVVRVDSPGPALFRQTRVGLRGRQFVLYKFRSMTVDAELGTGAVLATRDDPRVTRVGRWLRSSRLDEIPQLWNVVRGDMSLVGPRPERPEFVDLFLDDVDAYELRLTVRPGITGLAQVRAGYEATAVEKLRFDLLYVAQMSILSDVRIMVQTVSTMLDAESSAGVVEPVSAEAVIDLTEGQTATKGAIR